MQSTSDEEDTAAETEEETEVDNGAGDKDEVRMRLSEFGDEDEDEAEYQSLHRIGSTQREASPSPTSHLSTLLQPSLQSAAMPTKPSIQSAIEAKSFIITLRHTSPVPETNRRLSHVLTSFRNQTENRISLAKDISTRMIPQSWHCKAEEDLRRGW